MLCDNAIGLMHFPKSNNLFSNSLGSTNRRQLSTSRQASSNASEGGINRESSLDDSGVVDDHDDQDNTNTELVEVDVIINK